MLSLVPTALTLLNMIPPGMVLTEGVSGEQQNIFLLKNVIIINCSDQILG